MLQDKVIHEAYTKAQEGLVGLKTSVRHVLAYYPKGLRNVEIGHLLGIYHGHIGHEGHISKTLLAIMEEE